MPSLRIEEHHLIPPHTMKHHDYKQAWYRGALKSMLHAKYEGNKTAFFDTYQPAPQQESEPPDLEAEGMACFGRLARRMANQVWEAKGRAILANCAKKLMAAASRTDGALVLETAEDPVIVSIDFEGTPSCMGISEFGICTLDTREIFRSSQKLPELHSRNHNITGHRSRHFLFGETHCGGAPTLGDLVVNSLTIPETLPGVTGYRRVILVSHGIGGELRSMEDVGVGMDSLPMVVGTVDTARLAVKLMDQKSSLRGLVEALGISLNRNIDGAAKELHCAGNDANYTLRALLALLQIQMQPETVEQSPVASAALAVFGKIARSGIPTSPHRSAKGTKDESEVELCGTFLNRD